MLNIINIRFGAVELFALSSRKGTMLWHPTDLNRNGRTALELAVTLNKPMVVDYLLTEAKSDPNVLMSLLELTTNLSYLLKMEQD